MDVRILALRVASTSTQPQVDARMALAQELVGRARGGEDFCQLVAQYSDDVSTRGTCGSHGAQSFAALLPAIQAPVSSTTAGGVSDPVRVRFGQDEAIRVM